MKARHNSKLIWLEHSFLGLVFNKATCSNPLAAWLKLKICGDCVVTVESTQAVEQMKLGETPFSMSSLRQCKQMH